MTAEVFLMFYFHGKEFLQSCVLNESRTTILITHGTSGLWNSFAIIPVFSYVHKRAVFEYPATDFAVK
jgi:hypothetical protein